MKSRLAVVSALVAAALASPRPAYANNAPAPDGTLSLVLIVVVALIARWLAAVPPGSAPAVARVLGGVGVTLGLAAAFVVGAANSTPHLAALAFVVYGVWYGVGIVRRGERWQSGMLGVGVIGFTLFAAGNFQVSFNYSGGPVTRHAVAASTVRSVMNAQEWYRTNAHRDKNRNGVGEYGTLEELQQAGRLRDLSPAAYRFALVVSDDPAVREREFTIVATPREYGDQRWLDWLPGASAFGLHRPVARFTFAGDETGAVRCADLGGSLLAAREYIRTWPEVRGFSTCT
jgi:hypothetical protein